MDFKRFIRNIPDFPKPGILFKDITPLLAAPEAFGAAVDAMHAHYAGHRIDAVAAAEARGFLFASPLALRFQVPLVPLRKPGKLPYQTYSHEYELEYGRAELHVHIDGIQAGSSVLVVDDLLATGGTMEASCRLVEKTGGLVAGCAFFVELAFLNGRQKLHPHEVFSLVTF